MLASKGRIEPSAEPGRLQIEPTQRLQMLPPEPGLPPAGEIRPLLEIDILGLMRLQAERAAALSTQVPLGPLQKSQPDPEPQLHNRLPVEQLLSSVQAGSIVTVSPAQP